MKWTRPPTDGINVPKCSCHSSELRGSVDCMYAKADRDLKYDGKKPATVVDKLVENS
jgi:hypothetical protein